MGKQLDQNTAKSEVEGLEERPNSTLEVVAESTGSEVCVEEDTRTEQINTEEIEAGNTEQGKSPKKSRRKKKHTMQE